MRHCYIELLPGTNHSSSRTRQMGSYEILTSSLSLSQRWSADVTPQLSTVLCCKSAAAYLPLRGMCATRSGLLHLLHKHGEMARAMIRPGRESIRPHAARKMPAMQADCLPCLGSCPSVFLAFATAICLPLRCSCRYSCSMRRAPMRL